MEASIVDLRYRMKDVLRAIDRGETVTILYRGRTRAKLVPAEPPGSVPAEGVPRTEDQPLFGMWKDRSDLADPCAFVRFLRRPRSSPYGQDPKRRPATEKTK